MGRSVVVVVLLTVLVGCASETRPDAAPSATPVLIDDAPPLIVASGSKIYQYVNGRRDDLHRLSKGTVALALSGPDANGLVVQQELKDHSNVLRVIGGKESTFADNAGLVEAAFINDAPSVVYARCEESEGGETKGDLIIRKLGSTREKKLADSCGPEYGVGRVSFGGDVFVVSATSDLTEVFRFYKPDGTLVEDRPNPTDDLPYNEPPFMTEAVLSPDGKTLAYFEGPDTSGRGSGAKTTGWQLVVQDQGSGKETVRLKLDDPKEGFVRLDYDGDWVVISEGSDASVRLVDTSTNDPKEIALEGVDGIASIMRS
jgi:hypothetical protein